MSNDKDTLYQSLEDPLKCIRILELLPGVGDSPIHFRLHHKRLSDRKTRYEALSYTWGDENETQTVVFEDDEPFVPTKRQIRRNLWSFLRILRHSEKSRYLWADAICIDQDDVQEKNKQVSMMGRVFHKADRVLVWLGEAEKGFDTLLNTMLATHWARSRRATSTELEMYRTCAEYLLNRPYWQRTWIIQELLQARSITIHYGTCIVG